jgi:L-ribulose-5-phosphate 3-epimerase UlaE
MDRKTFNALADILAFANRVNDPVLTVDGISPQIEQVRAWMQEVEKEIDD